MRFIQERAFGRAAAPRHEYLNNGKFMMTNLCIFYNIYIMMLIFLECEFLRCVFFQFVCAWKNSCTKKWYWVFVYKKYIMGSFKAPCFFSNICDTQSVIHSALHGLIERQRVKKGSIELFFVCLFGMRWFDVQIMRYVRYKVYKKRATDFIFSSCVTISVCIIIIQGMIPHDHMKEFQFSCENPLLSYHFKDIKALSARRHWYFRQIEIVCLSFVFLYTYTTYVYIHITPLSHVILYFAYRGRVLENNNNNNNQFGEVWTWNRANDLFENVWARRTFLVCFTIHYRRILINV